MENYQADRIVTRCPCCDLLLDIIFQRDMKRLSDIITFLLLAFVVVGTLIQDCVFQTLGYLALGFTIIFIWINRINLFEDL